MYLAIKDDGLATIAEIAGSYGISKNHLMKVAHQLGVGGYIATIRGRSGGLRLAKPAERISVGEIVRRTEPDMALVPCFTPLDGPCAIRSCCELRFALDEARLAFVAVLDGYMLSDLVRPRAPLRNFLAIGVSNEPPVAAARRKSVRARLTGEPNGVSEKRPPASMQKAWRDVQRTSQFSAPRRHESAGADGLSMTAVKRGRIWRLPPGASGPLRSSDVRSTAMQVAQPDK